MTLRIGDKVITPDGLGVVNGFEYLTVKRVKVHLIEENIYYFTPVVYSQNEIKKEMKPCK